MFTRFSTVVVILLGLTALVNAGVLAHRSTDKRNVAQDNVALAREDSSEPFRRPPGVRREESSEPFRRPPGVQRGL
ncbi:hypothetical protein EDD22DRAFT_605329 [Suillus occidentalis]|nr:hypothetical protein EDD22DRAFT_605329 [Suillus occidentalis]